MLLFAGCDDDHIMQHDNQRRKYAKVKHDEYAGDGMYVGTKMCKFPLPVMDMPLCVWQSVRVTALFLDPLSELC
jgi:hypothetical protein